MLQCYKLCFNRGCWQSAWTVQLFPGDFREAAVELISPKLKFSQASNSHYLLQNLIQFNSNFGLTQFHPKYTSPLSPLSKSLHKYQVFVLTNERLRMGPFFIFLLLMCRTQWFQIGIFMSGTKQQVGKVVVAGTYSKDRRLSNVWVLRYTRMDNFWQLRVTMNGNHK